MRRALGLDHESAIPRSQNAAWPTDRQPHRRRFVADGEVPVVIVGHRDNGADATPSRGAAPPVNRHAEAELALKAEQEARQRAERSLTEAQATIRQLQTRLGHAVLALDEAVDAGRRAETDRLAAVAALETERDARQRAEDILHRACERAVGSQRFNEAPGRSPEQEETAIKRRDRPPGSKNRMPEVQLDAQEDHQCAREDGAHTAGQGEMMATVAAPGPVETQPKRRGRPPAAKNRVPKVRVKEPKPVRWW